jgi:DNA-damage-inducible protein J
MAQILVRVDDVTKRNADMLFTELGMTTQTAINVFMREAIRAKGFPFEVRLDPFYSESNMKALRESIAQFDDPTSPKIVKTMDELKAMENE